MSKYDFEIDISQNTSTGIILNKIKKGSVVLEFGCATGRMTRYMKEALACQVYIVEYDRSAYEMALQYANDGLCDDILNFQWLEKFGGIEFDAIVFADVLEHLKTPGKVLWNASKLLKNTGCMYVSIPNITHNDILLKAYEERFDYTPTGILDDTHVHFWGLKNLEMFSGRYGLNIRQIEGTHCPTGFTEQYGQAGTVDHALLTNVLKERQCGEVYQFVVTMDKNERADVTYAFKAPSMQSHIYLDTGNDFNGNEIIAFDSVYSGQGSYIAHYVINNTGKINRVRFDPIEGQGCILRYISFSQGNEKLSLVYPSAVEMEAGILLLGNDPMVYAEVLSKTEPIVIDADIVFAGEKYIQIIRDEYVKKCSKFASYVTTLKSTNEMLGENVDRLTIEKRELQGNIDRLTGVNEELRGEKDRLCSEVKQLNSEKDRLCGEVRQLTGEKEDLDRNLGAYIILANNKDKYALTLEQELNYYKNLRIVKLRFYIACRIRGVIRRFKRIIGKGEYE